MRTAGPTAQAAGPAGEGRPPKARGTPKPPAWAVGEHPPDCHSRGALSSPCLSGRGTYVLSGRFHGERPFFVVRRYFLRSCTDS